MISKVENIRETIASILKLDPSKIEANDDLIEKYGMDSMQRVEVIIELEKKYDIEIPDEDSMKMRSVRVIAEYVEAALSKTDNG